MIEKIETFIQNQIDDNIYHGASLAIYQDNKWLETYLGTQDGQLVVRPHLVYDLASVSKVVGVGTVLINMIENEILELDKPLVYYYPDFHDSSVTIRQLVTHTTGIDPFIKGRNSMNQEELVHAINHITVTADKSFHYTDINFLLLGFMLERYYGKSLDVLFKDKVFNPFEMFDTGFGPLKVSVPTDKYSLSGFVHDPKARVLGVHAGSAGLFSTLDDLKKFSEHYLKDKIYKNVWKNQGSFENPRAIAWNLDGDWIDHTGYTGPFIMINRNLQKAVIFLTNRTYAYDDRSLWIEKRRELRDVIKQSLE